MQTITITSTDNTLAQFMQDCQDRSFMNNCSLKAMKFDWCLDNGGLWTGTLKDNRLISVSGIHPFKDGWRALFRGAQLEPRPIGLNRHHMQSYPFYSHLPLQINWVEKHNNGPIYITTNVDNDMSGKMTRINKTFNILKNSKMIDHVGQEEVFYVEQNVWILNKEIYKEIRKKY